MTPVIAMPGRLNPSESSASAAAFPALPVLSDLLHGARRLGDAASWRSGVLRALELPDDERHNPANIAARAVPAIRPGSGVCLAMPVHVVAGMSRMFLAPPEHFELDPAEREDLRLAFNTEFGGTDVHLHAVGSGWLLQWASAAAASDGDPESLLGMALAREPAASEAGRSLRRLGAEVEMWLANLPFNAERERRGKPSINCIWFWSGAEVAGAPPPGSIPGGLFSNREPDAWIAGLAAHCELTVKLASTWQQVRDTPGALLILQPPLPGDVMRQMPAWELPWLVPVKQDLESRSLLSIRLQIGRSAWQLPAPLLSRWLQRRQPWWQRVSA